MEDGSQLSVELYMNSYFVKDIITILRYSRKSRPENDKTQMIRGNIAYYTIHSALSDRKEHISSMGETKFYVTMSCLKNVSLSDERKR